MADRSTPSQRVPSAIVVAANLLALLGPTSADPLRHPGGYRLEFWWTSVRCASYFDVLVLFGGLCLLLVAAVHAYFVYTRKPVLITAAVVCALHLLTRALLDVALVVRSLPWLDGWRALMFVGASASLVSLLVQVWILTRLRLGKGTQ
jgi:hypothetical protein